MTKDCHCRGRLQYSVKRKNSEVRVHSYGNRSETENYCSAKTNIKTTGHQMSPILCNNSFNVTTHLRGTTDLTLPVSLKKII